MERIRKLAVHFQVGLMGLALLGLMLVVVATGIVAAARVELAMHGVADREIPDSLLLEDLSQDVLHAQLALEQSFDNADHHLRDQRLARFERDVLAIEEAWQGFGLRAPLNTEERLLRSRFDEARETWIQLTAVVATLSRQQIGSTDPETHDLIEASREQSASMSAAIQALIAEHRGPLLERSLASVRNQTRFWRTSLVGLLVAALVVGAAVLRSGVRATRSQEEEILERDRDRSRAIRRREFESRVNRAFEMAQKEDEALNVVGRALEIALPGRQSEFLVAETSRCRFRRAAGPGDAETTAACPVPTPSECAAVRRGYALAFESSEALDACPQLRNRETGACSAYCAPVTIGGATVGVLHSTGPDRQMLQPEATRALSYLAARAGERLGYIQAFRRSEAEAATDSLTGLMNRRSLRERFRQLGPKDRPFAIAYGDLDHFKRLNDEHGHEAGDRALVHFARLLRDATKRTDLCARWGGEEFVALLPSCTAKNAKQVIDRARDGLAESLRGSSLPIFTVSFGVADSLRSDDLDDLLSAADRALFAAKHAGRDQVVISGQEPVIKDEASESG